MSATRVLIVAHRTAATPALLDAVRSRASRLDCEFTLLVPAAAHGLHRATDPEGHTTENDAQLVLDLALPLLEKAAGTPVTGLIGHNEPLTAVMDTVNERGFDEIIVSTLPARVSRWLKLDLPHKIGGLGLPVSTIIAHEHAPHTEPEPAAVTGQD